MPHLAPLPPPTFCPVQIRFELTQPGWMKKFQGSWRIEPFTQSSLDDLVNGAQRAQRVRDATPRGGLQQLQASLGSLQVG